MQLESYKNIEASRSDKKVVRRRFRSTVSFRCCGKTAVSIHSLVTSAPTATKILPLSAENLSSDEEISA